MVFNEYHVSYFLIKVLLHVQRMNTIYSACKWRLFDRPIGYSKTNNPIDIYYFSRSIVNEFGKLRFINLLSLLFIR